jgi:hypothetical protein
MAWGGGPTDDPTEPDNRLPDSDPGGGSGQGPCPGGKPLGADGKCPSPELPPTPAPGPASNFGPCPDGYEHGGGHPGNPCKPVQNAGGGGGGGGTAAPPFNPYAPQPGDDVEKQIWDYINGVLTGKNTAYSHAVVKQQKNAAFQAATGRAAADKQSLADDLISRGMFRAGPAAAGMSSIDRGASAQYSKDVLDIHSKKALSDFANRMQALTAAQQWLDSKRNYLIQRESNAIQREIGLAQIKLGYAKIASEKELLQLQLAKMGGGGGGGQTDTTGGLAEYCRFYPQSPGCNGQVPTGGY